MRRTRRAGLLAALTAAGALLALPASPADASAPEEPPSAHWTPERMAAAAPRDLVIDGRGLGYLRRPDGSLQPHGHRTDQLHPVPGAAPSKPTPTAKPPSGTADAAGPTVTALSPAAGATVGAVVTFSATVTDPSGVRSVTVEVRSPSGAVSRFGATASGSTWSVTLQGFTDGAWSWRVVALDGAKRGGNTTTTGWTSFTVVTGGGGGGGGSDVVTNAEWTDGGPVQTAAGRIFFEMPGTVPGSWVGYVCSGTVAEDATTGRSVVITAAHCVYDDANKVFARNVLFIPNQADTTGTRTDTDCTNDPMGCWLPSFGVVDTDWTTRTFPDNRAWDYAYYVVSDLDARQGTAPGTNPVLDAVAGDLPVQFTAPTTGALTHALGYSYSNDPNFMYCAEGLGTNGSVNWWLGQCGLSGGSSGGPWIQPMTAGEGPIMSVNSWGYSNGSPGMAGPRLSGSSAECLFEVARAQAFAGVTGRGVASC